MKYSGIPTRQAIARRASAERTTKATSEMTIIRAKKRMSNRNIVTASTKEPREISPLSVALCSAFCTPREALSKRQQRRSVSRIPVHHRAQNRRRQQPGSERHAGKIECRRAQRQWSNPTTASWRVVRAETWRPAPISRIGNALVAVPPGYTDIGLCAGRRALRLFTGNDLVA